MISAKTQNAKVIATKTALMDKIAVLESLVAGTAFNEEDEESLFQEQRLLQSHLNSIEQVWKYTWNLFFRRLMCVKEMLRGLRLITLTQHQTLIED